MSDNQVHRRTGSFARRNGWSIERCIERIRSDEDVRAEFIERLTINVTTFFRNPDRWMDLEHRYLPSMPDNIRVWSAGCSNGAEPLSMAILAHRNAKTADVLATDIDEVVLSKARRGRFNDNELHEMPPWVFREGYIVTDGSGWFVPGPVAAQVTFRYHDLVSDKPAGMNFDLVLCRNVVIYFDANVKRRVFETLARSLRPGGILFTGGAERVRNAASIGLTYEAPQIYRKTA